MDWKQAMGAAAPKHSLTSEAADAAATDNTSRVQQAFMSEAVDRK